jgi:eukaryotic-like serine/threonine-protein kinase
MGITIAITVLKGPHKNRRFCFQGPVRCMVGRAGDYSVRFSGDESDLTISRHHCRLDIDPPSVQLRDLGSLNGTYLNGKKLEPAQADPPDAIASFAEGVSVASVKAGDVITLGDTSFRIDMVDCPLPVVTELGGNTLESAGVKQECSALC